ncbi:NAD(P)-dependent dehydrogenase (short-subunit alcohol dehydrogenase family) [Nonomuraea thailandensis]|uniref:NAD(P)-dependent dehydrogenase (Short-subunit alcohol dehydrogenase family) n=1 Tax=Nonomuraea thailandensis TaxID=1188745 RepID=A0A9X2K210_9ACTN|nr:SDR family oxidoreductase [Nonomuraea thailandensis]MCP2357488.1 NAD(P)-dependent dehydrogenase (short-subunit alcohol dehydrogenase family) [Nonomuraea thailandensis]
MVIVLTGATRGIGRGLAEQFRARGHEVVGCGTSGGDVACDVRDREQVSAVWEAAVERHGRVDMWINNAGVTQARKPLWELDAGEARRVIDVNLAGVLNGCAVALRGMAAQGHGHVWNMEGLGSDGRTVPGLAVYGASKRALTYLTLALAKEVPPGVSVGLLSPGMVVTDLLLRDLNPRSRRVFDLLADRVETVTPWLAEQAVRRARNGAHVRWLTGRRIAARFALAPFTDRRVLP